MCSYFSCSEELQRFCVTVVLCKVGINFQAAGVLQLFESWGVFWVYFQVTFRMFSPVIWAQKEKSDNNMYIVTYRSQRLCLLPCSPSATPVGERSRSLQVSSVTCGSPQNTLQLQPGALGLKAPQVLRVCTWPRGICFPHARCTHGNPLMSMSAPLAVRGAGDLWCPAFSLGEHVWCIIAAKQAALCHQSPATIMLDTSTSVDVGLECGESHKWLVPSGARSHVCELRDSHMCL